MAAAALANARQLAGDLSEVDQILVRQEVEHFEAMSGIETENSYVVLGAAAQRAKFRMLAIEQSGVLARLVCGSRRPFTMKLVAAPLAAHDASARAGFAAAGIDARLRAAAPLLVLERPLRLARHEVVVRDGAGARLGRVVQECRVVARDFTVLDANDEPLLRIHCGFGLRHLVAPRWTFELLGLDGRPVGEIRKQWSGLLQEAFTDADNFGVALPAELAPTAKALSRSRPSRPSGMKLRPLSPPQALVLAATLLIDYLYFEDNEVQHQRGRRGPRRRF